MEAALPLEEEHCIICCCASPVGLKRRGTVQRRFLREYVNKVAVFKRIKWYFLFYDLFTDLF